MYSKGTLNSGLSPTTRLSLPPMNSSHSLPHPPQPPPHSVSLAFQHQEEYNEKTKKPYYPYKLPALQESPTSVYSYPSTSSSSYRYAQHQHQHQHTYAVEPSSLPPPTHSATISSPYSRQHVSPAPFSQQQQTLARSSTFTHAYQQEETYYPIYKHRKPKVAVKEEIIEIQVHDIEESSSMKRKREMTERMQEINREFTDNKEVLYRERLKQLQEELSAAEQGQHKTFNESIADLEEKRRETIQNAKLIMFYQISSVDRDCHLNYQLVEEESLAEQRELQNAMFLIIEEKRKRLKEHKDGELESLGTGFQKRNLRKRVESEVPTSTISKRKTDRSKENVGQLLNALDISDQEELEADLEAMRTYNSKPNNKK